MTFTLLVEGHTVHTWQKYGHPEEGSYYWHGSWGEHMGDDRGCYRYDLFFIGHVEGLSAVETDFTGRVMAPVGPRWL